MITTLTSITAFTAMQTVLLKASPKFDANFKISEEAKMEADRYRSIAARLGLGEGDGIKSWVATENIMNGDRTAPVEVEMTEEDRNILIALLEKDIAEKSETLIYNKQMHSTNHVISVYESMIEVLKSSVKELNSKEIQE